MDGICNDLNWPKYSKQLDKLKSFNRTFNSWGRSYFAVNSDFVIEIKRKYGILPKHQSTSPYAVVYNDFIDDQFENMYLDKENIDSNIKNKMYDAKCLRDTELKVYLFFEQFFYANDFEEFKNVLMKLNQDSKKNKDQLFKDFLDEFNLESFVDPLS